ncbi:Sec1-like protein [Entophlyctis helioformis]|nr:Sec1-like protein [Entophlyctis helioformis]
MSSKFSLRQLTKQELLADVARAVKSSPLPKVLVTDPKSLDILNSLLHHSDVFEANIRRIEDIFSKRQKDQSKGAIYFISPSAKSVDQLCKDFDQDPLYAEAYIMSVTITPDSIFKVMRASNARRYVKAWKDLNYDFIAAESRVFHFAQQQSLVHLYRPRSLTDLDRMLDQVARRMVSVLATMHHIPKILYVDPSGQGTNLAARTAWKIKNSCKTLDEFKESWKTVEPAQLVIVDRSLDAFTPMLHSLTYQSVVHDLFQVSRNTVSVPKISDDGHAGASTVTVDESDAVYAKLRHLFIVDAGKKWSELASENPALQAADALLRGEEPSRNIESIRAQVFGLLESQRILEQHDLLSEVNAKILARRIDVLATFEQTLATGEDTATGAPVQPAIIEQIQRFLEEPDIDPIDKLRLVSICKLRFPELEVAQFGDSIDASRARDMFAGLDTFNASEFIARDKSNSKWRYSHMGWREANEQGTSGGFLSKFIKQDETEEEAYEMHRSTPVLHYLLEDIVAKKGGGCPWLVPISASGKSDTMGQDRAVAAEGRGPGAVMKINGKFRPSWGTSHPSDPSDGAVMDYLKNGPRIIVLVLGGITQAELRAAYEVSHQYKRDIIIGSTNLVTPLQFCDDLSELGYESTVTRQIKLPPISELLKQDAARDAALEVARARAAAARAADASAAAAAAPALPPRQGEHAPRTQYSSLASPPSTASSASTTGQPPLATAQQPPSTYPTGRSPSAQSTTASTSATSTIGSPEQVVGQGVASPGLMQAQPPVPTQGQSQPQQQELASQTIPERKAPIAALPSMARQDSAGKAPAGQDASSMIGKSNTTVDHSRPADAAAITRRSPTAPTSLVLAKEPISESALPAKQHPESSQDAQTLQNARILYGQPTGSTTPSPQAATERADDVVVEAVRPRSAATFDLPATAVLAAPKARTSSLGSASAANASPTREEPPLDPVSVKEEGNEPPTAGGKAPVAAEASPTQAVKPLGQVPQTPPSRLSDNSPPLPHQTRSMGDAVHLFPPNPQATNRASWQAGDMPTHAATLTGFSGMNGPGASHEQQQQQQQQRRYSDAPYLAVAESLMGTQPPSHHQQNIAPFVQSPQTTHAIPARLSQPQYSQPPNWQQPTQGFPAQSPQQAHFIPPRSLPVGKGMPQQQHPSRGPPAVGQPAIGPPAVGPQTTSTGRWRHTRASTAAFSRSDWREEIHISSGSSSSSRLDHHSTRTRQRMPRQKHHQAQQA